MPHLVVVDGNRSRIWVLASLSLFLCVELEFPFHFLVGHATAETSGHLFSGSLPFSLGLPR